MKAVALEVFRILSGALGEEPAGKVVEYMEDVREVAEKAEQRTASLATRAAQTDTKAEALASRTDGLSTRTELKADLADVKAELKAEIADVKAELKADLADVKTELKTELRMGLADMRADMATKADLNVKIAQTKADLIKWMFIFWITQTLTILGLLVYFLGRTSA